MGVSRSRMFFLTPSDPPYFQYMFFFHSAKQAKPLEKLGKIGRGRPRYLISGIFRICWKKSLAEGLLSLGLFFLPRKIGLKISRSTWTPKIQRQTCEKERILAQNVLI